LSGFASALIRQWKSIIENTQMNQILFVIFMINNVEDIPLSYLLGLVEKNNENKSKSAIEFYLNDKSFRCSSAFHCCSLNKYSEF